MHNQEPTEFNIAFAPCSSAMNGEIEFIDDPMKKRVGE